MNLELPPAAGPGGLASPRASGAWLGSLLEVITVLVIAAILCFVALPGYQVGRCQKWSRRCPGRTDGCHDAPEQYFINSKRHATSWRNCSCRNRTTLTVRRRPAKLQASYRVALDVREGVYIGVLTVPSTGRQRTKPA